MRENAHATPKSSTAPTTPREKSPQRGESHSFSSSSRCAQSAATTASATVGPPASAQNATDPWAAGENAKNEATAVATTDTTTKPRATGRMVERERYPQAALRETAITTSVRALAAAALAALALAVEVALAVGRHGALAGVALRAAAAAVGVEVAARAGAVGALAAVALDARVAVGVEAALAVVAGAGAGGV